MWASALTVAALAAAALAAPAPAADLPPPLADADFRAAPPALAEAGRLLFWDPVLSGGRDISCGTCHNPRFGGGDGRALPLGAGARGVGPARSGPGATVGRNAPALWNLGARGFDRLMADGRIEAGPGNPAGLPAPLAAALGGWFDTPLAAQTLFPLLSPEEMAGGPGTDIGRAAAEGRIEAALALIAARVDALPGYRALFAAADPQVAAGAPVGFPLIARALAAHVAAAFRSDGSAFDAALRGEAPLPPAAARGWRLFAGPAGCAACHAGALLTDHGFHAAGAPQAGPGRPGPLDPPGTDRGRARVTGDPADAGAFRTPALRNVALTGPWGHAGQHDDLDAFVADHAAALGLNLGGDAGRAAIRAFLDALTDPAALARARAAVPATVPSGLPVDR